MTLVFLSRALSRVSRPVAAAILAGGLLAAMPALAHEYLLAGLKIGHPWSKAVPNGAKVAAGYLTVTNTGTTPDRLVAVSSPIAGKTEIHEMSVDAAGVMTMRPLPDGIAIPAGGEVALKPGGMHVMFMELKEPPVEGVKFKGSLTFEKAGTVALEFAVDAMDSKGHDHGG